MQDIIIIALLALAAAYAFSCALRNQGNCKSGCGCSGCSGHCRDKKNKS